MIIRHVVELRESTERDAQQLRLRTLKDLERVFNLASELAGGRVKTQTEGGRTKKLSLAERRRWLVVAAKAAEMIKRVTKGFDENEIRVGLQELEKLVV